jgi:hypothetical protein
MSNAPYKWKVGSAECKIQNRRRIPKTVNFSVIAALDNHNLYAGQEVLTRNEVAGVFGGIWNPSQRTRILNHGLHGFARIGQAGDLVDYILEKPLHRNIR